MLKGDFHIHSYFSKDSNLKPLFILKYLRKKGYSVIGITDHNSVKGALVAKRNNPFRDILVIIGQEIKTPQGEIIVFGNKKNLKGDIYEILDIVKENDYFSVLPHPFEIFRESAVASRVSENELKEIVKKIDAIEAFNARCFLNYFNRKARFFAKVAKKPQIGGSDAHTLSELGKVETIIDCDLDEDEIFSTIRKGKTKVSGNLNFPMVHGKSFILKCFRKF